MCWSDLYSGIHLVVLRWLLLQNLVCSPPGEELCPEVGPGAAEHCLAVLGWSVVFWVFLLRSASLWRFRGIWVIRSRAQNPWRRLDKPDSQQTAFQVYLFLRFLRTQQRRRTTIRPTIRSRTERTKRSKGSCSFIVTPNYNNAVLAPKAEFSEAHAGTCSRRRDENHHGVWGEKDLKEEDEWWTKGSLTNLKIQSFSALNFQPLPVWIFKRKHSPSTVLCSNTNVYDLF